MTQSQIHNSLKAENINIYFLSYGPAQAELLLVQL